MSDLIVAPNVPAEPVGNTLPEQLLNWALRHHPDKVSVIPAVAITRRITKRNDRRKRPALMELVLPDALAANLRGPVEERHCILVIDIEPEVLKRVNSRIVLP